MQSKYFKKHEEKVRHRLLHRLRQTKTDRDRQMDRHTFNSYLYYKSNCILSQPGHLKKNVTQNYVDIL